MRKLFFVLTIMLVSFPAFSAVDAQYSFEKTDLSFLSVKGGGKVNLSQERFKDGTSSIEFSWLGQAELSFNTVQDLQASMGVVKAGIMLWVYSPVELNAPLRFTFWDASGRKICWFDFNVSYRGWRTIWMKYDDMLADGGYWSDLPFADRNKDVVKMTITTPAQIPSGKIFIDRLSFRKVRMHDQITPDQQLPNNNCHLSRRNMWHWCRTWEWSQYPELEPCVMGAKETNTLASIENKVDQWANSNNPAAKYTHQTLVPRVENMMKQYDIRRLADGTVHGQPLLSDDEYNNSKNEMRIRFIQDIVYWSALEFLYTADEHFVETAILAMDHAIEQGFAYGSGQGTNHHYGYQIRNLYKGIWILRHELEKRGKLEQYEKVLTYWSGIAEVRKPLESQRDEILDSWHTLQMPKVVSALIHKDKGLRYAYMKALADWTGKTMRYTDGTLGGIKIDGTSFHHGGHYPAYSVGAFAELGLFCHFIKDTEFELDIEGRRAMKKSLLALQNYSQIRDWGFGVCGRHPFGGKIPEPDVQAYAYLAVLGSLKELSPAELKVDKSKGMIDTELASAYLALGGKDKEFISLFKKMGIKPVSPAEGFTVYNYGAFGIHRRDDWMLTLKGYNSDVWSSEIYTADNRFGRYLSYGSAQLMDGDSAGDSGYIQDGWDWNRIPGVTSIHLPFDLLNSPNKGTLMEKNDSRFPGVSSLEGMNGCLAFTYVEKDRKNFCAGATATKSVFCFDNRIVHIGTGISNNSEYPTETVLYQYRLDNKNIEIDVNDAYFTEFPMSYEHRHHDFVVTNDVRDNYFFIKDAYGLTIEKKLQSSPYDTKKKSGKGDFVSAYINHGISPANASYDYMLLVKPSLKEVSKYTRSTPYKVLQADNSAHVVKDEPTGITAYISYKDYSSSQTLVQKVSKETIVMERTRKDGSVVMSVCTPDLGITEKSYTTVQPSQVLVKTLSLKGEWTLENENPQVELSCSQNQTYLKVSCQHGQPVEFVLTSK